MGFTECLVYSGPNGFDTIGETHMRSTQSLRSGPCVALNQLFQYWFDSRRPSLVLSRKIVERFHFLRLSPPGDRWCDVLGFVPAVNDSSSSTLQIFRRKLLEMVALPASLIYSVTSLDSSMSRTAHPHTSSMMRVGRCPQASLGLPLHCSLFAQTH